MTLLDDDAASAERATEDRHWLADLGVSVAPASTLTSMWMTGG